MSNLQLFSSIDFTPEFKQNLHDLSKRYCNIRSDIQPSIEQLQQAHVLGDCIGSCGMYDFVFKVRICNSNIQKGKSAGYRLIYQIETPISILLLTIYSKSDREDIDANEIRDIVTNFYGEEG